MYPIALSADLVANAEPNTLLADIPLGTDSGNFAWLSWTGDRHASALADSLTIPGNSETYVNPDAPEDHQVSFGDWVQGKPGPSRSSAVRDALDLLNGVEIIVPVFDQVTGDGKSVLYHVAGFARVQIVSEASSSQGLSLIFLGLTNCGGGGGV